MSRYTIQEATRAQNAIDEIVSVSRRKNYFKAEQWRVTSFFKETCGNTKPYSYTTAEAIKTISESQDDISTKATAVAHAIKQYIIDIYTPSDDAGDYFNLLTPFLSDLLPVVHDPQALLIDIFNGALSGAINANGKKLDNLKKLAELFCTLKDFLDETDKDAIACQFHVVITETILEEKNTVLTGHRCATLQDTVSAELAKPSGEKNILLILAASFFYTKPLQNGSYRVLALTPITEALEVLTATGYLCIDYRKQLNHGAAALGYHNNLSTFTLQHAMRALVPDNLLGIRTSTTLHPPSDDEIASAASTLLALQSTLPDWSWQYCLKGFIEQYQFHSPMIEIQLYKAMKYDVTDVASHYCASTGSIDRDNFYALLHCNAEAKIEVVQRYAAAYVGSWRPGKGTLRKDLANVLIGDEATAVSMLTATHDYVETLLPADSEGEYPGKVFNLWILPAMLGLLSEDDEQILEQRSNFLTLFQNALANQALAPANQILLAKLIPFLLDAVFYQIENMQNETSTNEADVSTPLIPTDELNVFCFALLERCFELSVKDALKIALVDAVEKGRAFLNDEVCGALNAAQDQLATGYQSFGLGSTSATFTATRAGLEPEVAGLALRDISAEP